MQRQWNAQSANHWRFATEHRQRIMELIRQSTPASAGRVCILGAGNCNDLDLPTLAQRFSQTVLVDLDGEALQHAVVRQGVADAPSLMLRGGCDISGVWDDLERLAAAPQDSDLLERIVQNAESPSLPRPHAPFDLVVSTCVLSQLIKGVVEVLGQEHPRFLDVVSAVRRGHLRLLFDLAAPGGQALLITDFVSSDSAPEITTTADADLAGLAQRLLAQRNFFHGLNPAVVASLWQSDSRLAPSRGTLRVARPWRWDFGVRQYLVTAFTATKPVA